ncbi:MAG: pilus assembly protein PilP [Mariprofundus sp.]
MKRLTGVMICLILSPAAYATPDTDVPDAMQHLVTAPEIDFVNLRDPFASYLARVSTNGNSTLLENQMRLSNREREELEFFDLTSLKLVAIFSMGGERVAMIQDAASKGYTIRRGNYLGKNNGKIEKITDDTIYLVEQVLDPAGDIIDRQVTLTLNEVNQ